MRQYAVAGSQVIGGEVDHLGNMTLVLDDGQAISIGPIAQAKLAFPALMTNAEAEMQEEARVRAQRDAEAKAAKALLDQQIAQAAQAAAAHMVQPQDHVIVANAAPVRAQSSIPIPGSAPAPVPMISGRITEIPLDDDFGDGGCSDPNCQECHPR